MSLVPATLFELPSVQRFLDRLIEDLSSERSLFVLLPTGVSLRHFGDYLRAELARREFSFQELSLAAPGDDQPPLSALSENLDIHWPAEDTPRTIENLLRTQQLPEIVILEDLDQASKAACRNWGSFLAQWARVCQSWIDDRIYAPALCLLGTATSLLPEIPESSNVYLAVHWWWGFPSALEMHTLCRWSSPVDAIIERNRWRECMLSSIAGGDFLLASELWDVARLDEASLPDVLCSVAAKRGWHRDTLLSWGVDERDASHYSTLFREALHPPKELRALWAHGVVGQTAEYGIELNAVALAVLQRYDELNHRVWRGQAHLLFPLIDRIRLDLCNILTRRYGPDWPVRWIRPQLEAEEKAVLQNPRACQWGHLAYLLENQTPIDLESQWSSLAIAIRYIRNHMAHFKPISFHDFERVLDLAQHLNYS